MDPFQAPENDALHNDALDATPGQLDIGRAFSDGFDAMKRNFLTFLLVGIASFPLILVMECSLVGLIAIPVLLWGMLRFLLDTLDGEPEFNVIFSGFKDFGTNLVGIGGVYFLLIGAMMPFYIFLYGAMFGGLALQAVLAPDALQNDGAPIFLLAGYLIGMLSLPLMMWVMLRLYFGFFFVVDQGMGPLQAMKASWNATRGNTLKLLGFGLASVLCIIAGELALIVGVIPAMMVTYAAFASAYRQLANREPAAA